MKTCILEVTITNKCSCHCKYCFEKERPVSSREEELRQLSLIKKFCENFSTSGFDRFVLQFWGGEPLNNTRFLYELIEATEKYPFMDYLIYTNGNEKSAWIDLMNQTWFDNIKSRTLVRVSYDGDPVHEKNRGVSSDNVLWLVDELRSRDVNTIVLATVTLDDVSYMEQSWDSYKLLKEKHPCVSYTPILDTTDDSDDTLDTFKTVLKNIALKEYDFMQNHPVPVCTWFLEKDAQLNCERHCVRDYFVNLHTDGKFYFCYGCNSFPWADKLSLGDTTTCEDLGTMFRKYDFGPKNAECLACDSVFCFTCHAANIPFPESMDDFISKWHKNRNAKHKRCKYYKMAGRMNRLLLRAVRSHNKSLLEDSEELSKVFG